MDFMIKNFYSPKIKIWFEPMFLTGSFAVLSGAAPPPFRIFAGGFPRPEPVEGRNAFEPYFAESGISFCPEKSVRFGGRAKRGDI
ncbi:MAG: hypothetical protein A3B91_04000 [Candidatus Yanofskybacteria bacterium RIFCSPHIGHO2_02_FULL_41_29]|uniref:Uncharacterized protein n=1 Tax=Candidatus Yanofskybacteria bacterium RIFCSPHIGHO2_01_FULL_41_53 TaxID=1802663 RepID=A0A1F8EGY0_9BACT|nr:MAG: hypothetical protein A2650_02525 [Candidatus Yanofskybacteria bacterium RIFCSPHIGHO2_01_FULL_41_53]OGN10911.1 MAG: hypothetical protein A3B91_04000 [Candidatus Yanofskybacteria bacterium RIFCSPHIGHO2_02_FULL_41_29]